MQAFGDQPNDLRDRRDLLLDELSQLIDISYYENQDGTISVSIGGHSLVMGNDYSQLQVQHDSNNGMHWKVTWQDSGTPLTVANVPLAGGLDAVQGVAVGGTLGGAFYVRDVLAPDLIAELDTLAAGLIESINALHASGFGMPDESVQPAEPRPGSAIGTVSPPLPSASVVDVSVTATCTTGLGAGNYTVMTRDNGGTWEFKVVDWAGRAVEVADASGMGMTSDWQAIPLGTVYDSQRGFALQFDGAGEAGEVTFAYQNFFSGRMANDIDVSSWVRQQPLNVATAASGDATGDNAVALSISRLRTAAVIGGESTVDGYYNATITDIGLAAKQATAMVANARGLVDHLQRRKDEVSAVDLDEEAVNLIQYQRAYQGAARVLTAVDEMLDRLINGTGRVGL